jgi:hypothetical protein
VIYVLPSVFFEREEEICGGNKTASREAISPYIPVDGILIYRKE